MTGRLAERFRTAGLKRRLVIGAAAAALLLAYLPALHGGFIWDDDSYIVGNQNLRSFQGLTRIWSQPSVVPQYYPLFDTVLWIEYRLWHLNTLGYHLTNLLLHALSSYVLWRILRRLAVPLPGFIALVFAFHPVQVESVAWMTEKKNLLSGLFYFLSMQSYLRFALPEDARDFAAGDRRSPAGKVRAEGSAQRRHYVFALVFFLGALLSKTATATLPAALFLLVWWKRGRLQRCDVLTLVPFFLLGIGLASVTAWLEGHMVGAEGDAWRLSLLDRCLLAGRAFWFYIGKVVWPARLTFIYPRWQIDSGQWWQFLFPLAALGLILSLFLARRRITPAPLMAVLCYAVTILPALGFFNVYAFRFSFVADHFQYLAMIGIVALVAGAGGRLLGRAGGRFPGAIRRFPLLPAILLLGLCLLTFRQSRSYADAETLWGDTLNKNPACWMAHTNLASVLSQQNRIPDALVHYQEAVRLKPGYSLGENNLGVALDKLGRREEAMRHYRAAVAINPKSVNAIMNLANSVSAQGNLEEAARLYRQVLSLAPNLPEGLNNYGRVLLQLGKAEEALAPLERGVRINSRLPLLWVNLGRAQQELGRTAEAERSFRQALRCDSNSLEAHLYLGLHLRQQGRLEDAVAEFKTVLRADPRNTQAAENLREITESPAAPSR